MRQTNFALAVMAAAVLAACGGSDNNTTAPVAAKPVFASQVSFGDSLSDVGSYRVGTVAAIGGGTFTINGNNVVAGNAATTTLTGKNWTEVTASTLGLPAPCAAVTGLDGVASQGFSVPVVNNLSCTGYGQGGSRVSNPVGISNKLTGSAIGALTHPVSVQVATYLTRNNGAFNGKEVVMVLAGANDLLVKLGGLTAAANAAGATAGNTAFANTLVPLLAAGATNPQTAAQAISVAMATEAARPGSTSTTLVGAAVQAAATQPGNSAVASAAVYGPMVATAQAAATTAGTTAGNNYAAANGPALVGEMGDVGLELAALIKSQILAKGAKHVVVLNIPDVVNAPTGQAQTASARTLIGGMVTAFNTALKAGLDGTDANVLQIDTFTSSTDQIKNKDKYGYSNTTTPACGANPLGLTSLGCKGSTVIAGDVSKYMFADDTHPTPYAHTKIAELVIAGMVAKGWR
ncbi:MAG: SGNH/GDSL hydrolase family protein [Pseudomonadota bacterium]